ncbi:dynamin family protein [Xylophilus sp. Leaf220]|uniref:dynamin family protein n=1 Tax=Xylophilus sp. Leaf220 TaxID=1735686 RepID=UPI0006F6CF5E|nr:dynamin family protein [Xylophilus sp. Leaf220]KQM71159.1 dynamin family protein [Xylophilus sp. Leaf220]
MNPSSSEQFDRHGAWRSETARKLREMSTWLVAHELADSALSGRLEHIADGLGSDRVVVAFVAEFSRGKSELINAIFFAQHGRRIVPASAGRTTMCPTELAYDAGEPCSVRLLPIETRLDSRALADWRATPDAWRRFPLDLADPAQMAQTLETVSQVRRVSPGMARDLGFWNDDTPDDNPMTGSDGMVEVPMWRHALVNIDHPLLRQGLVVLDTPGLNAVGAEPELTVNLLSEAHATVFLLAADAGVTRSDLGLWREHLAPAAGQSEVRSRVVVLNKIDVLWDGMLTPQQIQAQTDRQRTTSAALLGVPVGRVIPVSAQKGLLARINNDAAMLQASGLPILEDVLIHGIVDRRHAILRGAVAAAVVRMRSDAARTLTMRRREIDDQMLELRSLRGKNANVIAGMRTRVEQEQQEFDASDKRVQALRMVHRRMRQEAVALLRGKTPAPEFVALLAGLGSGVMKLNARRGYQQAFAQVAERVSQAQRMALEMHAMLEASFRQLNAEHGFSLQVPPPPALGPHERELAAIGETHLHYVGVGNALRLAQPDFAGRLVRALASRVQVVLDDAATELEGWSRAAAAPVDSQLKERRQGFVRRIEAIDRIQQAASGLGERMAELEQQVEDLATLEASVAAWAQHFETPAARNAPATSAA